MKNNLKKGIILSVVTICLLLVLLTGSTYALFSDDAKVSMVVSSAQVKLDANISNFETSSFNVEQTKGEFALGGTAVLSDTGVLELTNVAPGDKVQFTISVTNSSTITTIQRVLVAEEVKTGEAAEKATLLYEALEITLFTKDANGLTPLTAGAWNDVAALTNTEIVVVVEVPDLNNDYQGLSCSLKITIEAYQANADKSKLA